MPADFTGPPIYKQDGTGVVSSIEFLTMVRSVGILTKNASQSDIENVARLQAYPRIGLILTAAKTRDNQPLFGGVNANADARFNAVLDEINPETGLYWSGIRRVAAYLTASVLTRNIPVNSGVQFLASGDTMEKQAIEDLDRIIALYLDTATDKIDDQNKAALSSTVTFYIALGIDTSSSGITPDLYDTVQVGDSLTDYDGSTKKAVQLKNARTYTKLPPMGEDRVGFGWFYTTAANPIEDPLEGIFEVKAGSTCETIIQDLADAINTATLASKVTNLLASPNTGSEIVEKVSVQKGVLFPNDVIPLQSSDPNVITKHSNKYRSAEFLLQYHLNSLSFDVRRYSNEVHHEVIILSFYTTSVSDYNKYKEKAKILRSSDSTSIGIEGLVFGIAPIFTSLKKEGPQSLLLQVEQTKASGLETSLGKNDQLLLASVNTFYFQKDSEVLSLGSIGNSIFSWRVSTTLPEAVYIDYSIDLLDPVNPITTIDELALAFLEKMFVYTSSSQGISQSSTPGRAQASSPGGNNVLGVLAYTNAVHIVAFKPLDKNVKAIVDITKVPFNIKIATGTPLEEKTPYKVGPRSIVVDATQTISASSTEEAVELLDTVKASVEVVPAKLSPRLQSVYDKLDILKNRC